MSESSGKQIKKRTKSFHIKLPADTANLDIIRKFVAGIAENIGFPEEEVYKIELAVDEACSNVVKHAYMTNSREEHIVNILVYEKRDHIEIIISDKGKGFDPKKIKKPELEEYMKKMKRGGLGIYLIRELMDKVSFRIKAGVRNEVRMIKYLDK